MPEGAAQDYELYRLMRMFPGLTPDQIDELPAGFIAWSFQFQRVESEARAELEQEAAKRG